MFSAINKSLRGNLKLTAIFGAVFWLTAIVLYLFVFIYIYTTLRQEDRTSLQVRLLGYWAIERSGGLDLLAESVDVNTILPGEAPFFVRISDEFNSTYLLETPQRWESFNFSTLESDPPDPGSFKVLRSPSHKYILETGTIRLSDGYFLQVGISDETRRRIMEMLSKSFVAAFLVLIFVSFAAGFLISYRYLKPVRRLESTVADIIMTGKIQRRIEIETNGSELNELSLSFNRMLERIENLVNGMKGALDTVAHDLRTPITRFRMIAEQALSLSGGHSADPEMLQTALEKAVEESDTLLRMMSMLMDISEAETGTLRLNLSRFAPLDVIREASDVYSILAEDRGMRITISDDSWDGEITADQDRFRQVTGNLLDNAVKYGKSGGEVMVSVSAVSDEAVISVKDDGEGIAEEDVSRIWERLYRGKSSMNGLGLGLSLVNAIVTAHDGRAEVFSTPGQGSDFRVIFPLITTDNNLQDTD